MINISLSKLCNDYRDKAQVSVLHAHKHGRNLVGDTGDVSLHCFRWKGYNMSCPPTFFSFGFVFGEVSKIKVMFVTLLVKSFQC